MFSNHGGAGQVGERVELAVRRSLDFHGGGAEASASTRFTKKKKGKANLLRHTLSTFHRNWGLFLLDLSPVSRTQLPVSPLSPASPSSYSSSLFNNRSHSASKLPQLSPAAMWQIMYFTPLPPPPLCFWHPSCLLRCCFRRSSLVTKLEVFWFSFSTSATSLHAEGRGGYRIVDLVKERANSKKSGWR